MAFELKPGDEIGVSATQRGFTEHQHAAVAGLLDVLGARGATVHIGDCIGGDAEIHAMCVERGFRTVGHPPTDPRKRAFLKYDELWPEYEYHVRNQHIVNCSAAMVFGPHTLVEIQRSGTWSTKRKAEVKGIPFFVVLPTGRIEHNLNGR